MDTHAFKRSLHHSERYNRRGFGRAEEVAENLEQAYQSGLIGTIRDNGYKLTHGRLNVHLAEAFGFCWGVERAVAMAYETRRHYQGSGCGSPTKSSTTPPSTIICARWTFCLFRLRRE